MQSSLPSTVNAVSGIAASAALVVAFTIQQTVEIVDTWASAVLDTDKDPEKARWKKAVLKLISLALGIYAATAMGVDVLAGVTSIGQQWHPAITSIALAGGTEGVNSLLKYAGYAKENKKNQAASTLDPAKKD